MSPSSMVNKANLYNPYIATSTKDSILDTFLFVVMGTKITVCQIFVNAQERNQSMPQERGFITARMHFRSGPCTEVVERHTCTWFVDLHSRGERNVCLDGSATARGSCSALCATVRIDVSCIITNNGTVASWKTKKEEGFALHIVVRELSSGDQLHRCIASSKKTVHRQFPRATSQMHLLSLGLEPSR